MLGLCLCAIACEKLLEENWTQIVPTPTYEHKQPIWARVLNCAALKYVNGDSTTTEMLLTTPTNQR